MIEKEDFSDWIEAADRIEKSVQRTFCIHEEDTANKTE